MKKLMSLAAVAAVALPLVAQEAEKAEEPRQQNKTEVRSESTVWPAFFAVCEFPAAPDVTGVRLTIPFSTRQDLVNLLGEQAEHPDDWRRFSAVARAEKLRNGEVQFTTVVGTGDFFFGVNRALHDLLSSNRVAHVHLEVRGIDEEHSTHTRTFAYEAMKTVFARFGEFFGSEGR